MLSIIVAINKNNCIGLNGTMPWKNPEDLKHFKNTTMDHVVVMGRKTFEGLPKLLEGRDIKIVSRSNSGDNYIDDFETFLIQNKDSENEIFIAGGGEVYRQSLAYVNRIYLSIIEDDTIGDTYFPEISSEDFKLVERKQFETFELQIHERK